MPAAATINVAGIGNLIIDEAIRRGSATWTNIQSAAPLYIRGYAQTLAAIAAGVARGEITQADARMYVRNARLLLVMGIANTSHIVLIQVQTFIDNVIRAVKTSINGMLPIAIL
jgi:hypothetical protein